MRLAKTLPVYMKSETIARNKHDQKVSRFSSQLKSLTVKRVCRKLVIDWRGNIFLNGEVTLGSNLFLWKLFLLTHNVAELNTSNPAFTVPRVTFCSHAPKLEGPLSNFLHSWSRVLELPLLGSASLIQTKLKFARCRFISIHYKYFHCARVILRAWRASISCVCERSYVFLLLDCRHRCQRRRKVSSRITKIKTKDMFIWPWQVRTTLRKNDFPKGWCNFWFAFKTIAWGLVQIWSLLVFFICRFREWWSQLSDPDEPDDGVFTNVVIRIRMINIWASPHGRCNIGHVADKMIRDVQCVKRNDSQNFSARIID